MVGGGPSGLALALRLHRTGVPFDVYDARPRWGGRIASRHHGGAAFDLGPSWFWPGQPRIACLLRDLGLTAFSQHAEGDGLYEAGDGTVTRTTGVVSMAGAMRVQGEMAAIVDAIVARLPAKRLNLAHPVRGLTADGVLTFADGRTHRAGRIVLALPPRLAATLDFAPPLESRTIQSLSSIPMWMAGHAKVVAVYDRPFWRDYGLSGDAASRRGPLAEIHDASAANGMPGALFGFLGVPAAARAGRQGETKDAVVAQFARLFGPAAAAPDAMWIEDWARAPETASPRDGAGPGGHPPDVGPPPLPAIWSERLHIAGTEVGMRHAGLLEGALEATEATAHALTTDAVASHDDER